MIATGVARRQAREAGHSYQAELRVLALHGCCTCWATIITTAHDNGRMARVERGCGARAAWRGPDRTGIGAAVRTARDGDEMIPLLLFLLAIAAVYVGTIETAFSALMRLSLRLMAERGGRDDRLGFYLDDPIQLFVPARLLLGLIFSLATVVLAVLTGRPRASPSIGMLLAVRGGLHPRLRAPAAARSSCGATPRRARARCCRRSTSPRASCHPLTGALVRLLVDGRRERADRRAAGTARGGARARRRTPISRPARSRG